MKLRNKLLKYNLQYFADNNGNADQNEADNSGDGDDDQDDDDQDDKGSGDKGKKSDKKKYFTQEELDEAIKKRLERERKKAEKKTAKKEKSEDNPADKKATENNEKLSALEEKVLCYDHDIAKEYVKEAIALAKVYVDEDTDMDEALEMVTKKFPQFVKGYKTDKGQDDDENEEDTNNKGAWGQRQKGASKKIDPVEARFLEKNPGLKID